MNKKFCDRCKREIRIVRDETITDFLTKEYPGKDICQHCDLEITLASTLAKSDTMHNQKPGTALKIMAERYGISTK